jgi:hypothetical protein
MKATARILQMNEAATNPDDFVRSCLRARFDRVFGRSAMVNAIALIYPKVTGRFDLRLDPSRRTSRSRLYLRNAGASAAKRQSFVPVFKRACAPIIGRSQALRV